MLMKLRIIVPGEITDLVAFEYEGSVKNFKKIIPWLKAMLTQVLEGDAIYGKTEGKPE